MTGVVNNSRSLLPSHPSGALANGLPASRFDAERAAIPPVTRSTSTLGFALSVIRDLSVDHLRLREAKRV